LEITTIFLSQKKNIPGMKTTTLQPREILAWIILVCAIILFSVTVSLAQDIKEKKSEIKIRIQKDADGKQIEIDTTITSDQLPALKEYLKDLDIDLDAESSGSGNGKMENGEMVLRFKHPQMSKEEREAFEKEMEGLNKEMEDLDHEMKDFHIEMFGFNDGDPENFDIHMHMPKTPGQPDAFYFGDDDSDSDCGSGNKFSYRFRHHNDEIPDSLDDEKHVILYGSKGEEAPVIEKEIITKDGNKVFILKRNLPKEAQAKVSASMPITKVKVYPNPGNGKLSVSFTAATKGDVTISITDAKGAEVYNKTIDAFSGEFFSQVDISGKGKGTYYLKIEQGDDSITKKILVE
jgi:hypothetical protein